MTHIILFSFIYGTSTLAIRRGYRTLLLVNSVVSLQAPHSFWSPHPGPPSPGYTILCPPQGVAIAMPLHMGKLGLSSICLRCSHFEPEIMLKVCIISKCCPLWLSFSKDCFMQKSCFLSLNLILCVIPFLHLIWEEIEVRQKIQRLEICLV